MLASRKDAGDEKVAVKQGNPFLQGLVTNILNPKVALFYVAFLPQFISRSDPVVAKTFLLVGIHYGISALWLSVIGLMVSRSATAFKASSLKKWAERVTGVVFIGLGAKLALEQR